MCSRDVVVAELKKAEQRWRRRKTKSAILPADIFERTDFAEEHEHTDFWAWADMWVDCFSCSMPMCEAPLRSTMAWIPDDEIYAPWATGPKDHRYKGWCCHYFYGFGPDRSTRQKRAKMLLLEQYKASERGSALGFAAKIGALRVPNKTTRR